MWTPICICAPRSSLGIVPFDVGWSTFPKSDTFKTDRHGPDDKAISKGQRTGVGIGVQMVALRELQREEGVCLWIWLFPFPETAPTR